MIRLTARRRHERGETFPITLAMKKAFLLLVLMSAVFDTALTSPVVAGPYYVVVGTFSGQGDARRFATAISGLFSEASFKFDAGRKLYHVHVMETTRHEEAVGFRNDLQRESSFRHAWIYIDLSSDGSDGDGPLSEDFVTLELYTGGAVVLGSTNNSYLSVTRAQLQKGDTAQRASTLAFRFTAETMNGIKIPAEVRVVSGRGSTVSSFKTDDVVAISGNEGSRLILLCEAPGYSSEPRLIDPFNPGGHQDGPGQGREGIREIRFGINRLKVDEFSLSYPSMFYEDAAVFRPASKRSIDVLVSLLKANPRWRIVANIHCNRGQKRKIRLPARRGHYFDPGEVIERSAIDKQLTGKQGETLRDYLIENGIDGDRIKVMGWGSLHPLVSDAAPNAAINDRIEIEFIF